MSQSNLFRPLNIGNVGAQTPDRNGSALSIPSDRRPNPNIMTKDYTGQQAVVHGT
ncbi:hypothetical protein VD0002_g10050 [Verticillium dahliae]|nr:hypothetical protein VD0003_g10141 [Verticillium dahliae]PNH53815.1 hypothetical protein VD0002_g10050 [Verticillium dahliae]